MADNLIERGGSSIWTFQRIDNTDPNQVLDGQLFRIEVDSISKNTDGNYVLSSVINLEGYSFSSGTGYNWLVVSVFAPPAGADGLIGVVSKAKLPSDTVYREQLQGSETDRYASYTSAFIAASGDRRGSIALFSQVSGPPTDANIIGQPSIDDSSGIIALGAILRTDRDPNHLVWAPANVAGDYSNGDVLHVSVWNKPSARLVVTLTSDGTLVGTGNAAYIWATATWDEVENIPDVPEVGNYFAITENEPSKLPIDIPASDVLDPPWVRTDGTNVTEEVIDAVQGDNETVTIPETFRVDVNNVDRYVQFTEPGGSLPNILNIRVPATDTRNRTDLARLLQRRAWVDVGGYRLEITANATLSVIGTGSHIYRQLQYPYRHQAYWIRSGYSQGYR